MFFCNLFIFVCMGFNAIISNFKGSQSLKDLPGCHNQCFPQIFASNLQLSHLVSGRRQVTSQCAFGQLSVVHSPPDRQKEEELIDNAKTISPSKSTAGDNKNPLPRYASRQKVYQSTMYIWKVTKGHNSISSWCSAAKPGVSRPHMQVHIL